MLNEMKIALAMAYDNSSRHGVPYDQLGDLSASNKKRYAGRWGYDLVIERDKKDAKREMHWAKLTTLLDVLPRYDWVFWTDADSLVMNFGKKIQEGDPDVVRNDPAVIAAYLGGEAA